MSGGTAVSSRQKTRTVNAHFRMRNAESRMEKDVEEQKQGARRNSSQIVMSRHCHRVVLKSEFVISKIHILSTKAET